jgi:aldose 1-epimerase
MRGIAICMAVTLLYFTAIAEAKVQRDSFGKTRDGRAVARYTLENDSGTQARIITYGGIITELLVKDRDGQLADIVLGFDNIKQYETENPYFGCIAGRVANRIAGGAFALDGKTYTLAVNNGPNHLHGGIKGFDKVVWDAKEVMHPDGEAVRLSYLSKDGEEGYPGNLKVAVTYILTRDNALRIDYEATTDQATPINLTNHSYFNLAGGGRDVLDHIMTLHARYYTEPDDTLIPTGRILPVAGTPLDFLKPSSVGGRIGQIAIGGYDHNFVLDNGGRAEVGLAAEVYEPVSGRVMEVYTNEPAVQIYSGIHLADVKGKDGAVYNRYYGLCLETQHYPDSINQPGFPSIVLRPGETYRTSTLHKFSTR